MPCYVVDIPGGGTALVKMAAPRRKRCSICGEPGGRLCDFPVGAGKTCDASLCGRCAVPIRKDVEYCPTHPRP
jgi:hypothetical protein